jgi:hypothetical protein
MSRRLHSASAWSRSAALGIALVALLGATGCQSMLTMTAELFALPPDPEKLAELEEQHRKQYQTERSRDSLRWLLANRIHQGMSHADVARVLGEDGAHEENARWIKQNSTVYREDDELFRFGPDDNGRSIYLPFRNGKLTNYDPKLFLPTDSEA